MRRERSAAGHRTSIVRAGVVRSALAAAVALVAVSSVQGAIPRASAAAPAASAAYVAVQPCRLTDTRNGTGFTRVDARTLLIATRGVCGIPTGATAVALTLTVVDPQASGYLSAWPANQPQPTVSSLNFSAHQIRANGSITKVDGNGSFRVSVSVAAQVVIDVAGAFVPASSSRSGRFVPTAPSRAYDSRQSGTKFVAGSTFSLGLPPGIPADAVALAVNVTITESMGAGFVTEYPAGQQQPTSSILNVDGANQTRAVSGILPVSMAGMSLYVSGGGFVIVDVLGYFTGASAAASSDGLFTAYDPQRLLDTRGASPLGNGTPLFANGGLELSTMQGGSMAYNLTSVNGDAGYVTAYPAGTAVPPTSSVNSVGNGDVVANFAITQVSNRGLGVFSQQRTDLVIDLQGWFSGPSAVATLAAPTNIDPNATRAVAGPAQVTISECTHDGLDVLNTRRAQSGVSALATTAGEQAFSCTWAMHMAQGYNASTPGSALVHSAAGDRDAAVGCPTGENIAFSSGADPAQLYSLWFHSAPHLANIIDAGYASAATSFVVRTEANGAQTIWGVTDFALC